MKKYYYEVTIRGMTSTCSTLAKAIEMSRKSLGYYGIKDWKKIRPIIDSKNFSSQSEPPKLIAETVEEIPEEEIKRLKKTSKEPEWFPDSNLTFEQKEKIGKALSSQSIIYLAIPDSVNEINRVVITPKTKAILKLNPQYKIGVYDGTKEIYTVWNGINYATGKITYSLMSNTSLNYEHQNIKQFQNLFKTIQERFALDKNCNTDEVEIVIGQDVKNLIQKLAKYQEVCAEQNLSKKYSEPVSSLNSIDFEKDLDSAFREINAYLDNIEPSDKILENIPDVEESNIELNKNGIFSNVNDGYTSFRVLESVKRIQSVDGCVCAKNVWEMPIEKPKDWTGVTSGSCQADGIIKMKIESPRNAVELSKNCKSNGWWSTGSVLGTFVHEDTHAMVNFIESVLGEKPVENEFKPFVKKLRSGSTTMEFVLLSFYGATDSANGSKYHEMVAESRAEVVCDGKNSRPFARGVYTVLMKLYKRALEASK